MNDKSVQVCLTIVHGCHDRISLFDDMTDRQVTIPVGENIHKPNEMTP